MVFTALGCGPQVLSLLYTLVLDKKSHAWVIVNGFLTDPMYLNCGASQGHDLSCPIYILTLQPLVDTLTIQYLATSILHTPNDLPSIHTLTTLVFVHDITFILTKLDALPCLNTLKDNWKAASGGIFRIKQSLQLCLNHPPNDPLFFPDTKGLSPIDIWKWVGFPCSYSNITDPFYFTLPSSIKNNSTMLVLFSSPSILVSICQHLHQHLY